MSASSAAFWSLTAKMSDSPAGTTTAATMAATATPVRQRDGSRRAHSPSVAIARPAYTATTGRSGSHACW